MYRGLLRCGVIISYKRETFIKLQASFKCVALHLRWCFLARWPICSESSGDRVAIRLRVMGHEDLKSELRSKVTRGLCPGSVGMTLCNWERDHIHTFNGIYLQYHATRFVDRRRRTVNL